MKKNILIGISLIVIVIGMIACKKKTVTSVEEKVPEKVYSGAVMLYADLEESELINIKKAFETKYPGITMDYYFNIDDKILKKMQVEKLYDQLNADVIIVNNPLSVEKFKEENFIVQYTSEETKKIDKKFLDEKGYYTPIQFIIPGLSYVENDDTKENPKSWNDLLNEKYKNSVAMTNPKNAFYYKYFVACMMQNSKYGKEYFENLKNNGLKFEQIYNDTVLEVSNKKYSVGVCFDNNFGNFVETNEKLKFCYPNSDIIAIPYAAALVSGCLNKENGQLLIDFLMSNEGQNIIVSNGFTSCKKDVTNTYDTKNIEKKLYVPDMDDLINNIDNYNAEFNEVMGG